jgi:hypothetical protein
MTAVEWLADFFESGVTSSEEWTRAKKQAKEMEEEQKQLWWSKGWNEGHMSTLQENTETFKSE